MFLNNENIDLPCVDYGITVRLYLETIFRNRWIGRQRHEECTLRSPDLSPLFCL